MTFTPNSTGAPEISLWDVRGYAPYRNAGPI